MIIYVLCYDEVTQKAATDAFGAFEWARITFMPTTMYMENWVYSEFLDAHRSEWEGCDYVGTISWKAPTKIYMPDMAKVATVIARQGAAGVNVDAIALFSWPKETLLQQARETHFESLWVDWLKLMGYTESDARASDIPLFLCNYWLAKPSLMNDYIRFFKRAKYILDSDPSLIDRLWANSGYNVTIERQRCIDVYGRPYYPHHCFLAERLAPFFFHQGGATVLHCRFLRLSPTAGVWQYVGMQNGKERFSVIPKKEGK
jgi:hypothetical protein